MQIYFHSRLWSYLSRVPILVEGTVYHHLQLNLIKPVNNMSRSYFTPKQKVLLKENEASGSLKILALWKKKKSHSHYGNM